MKKLNLGCGGNSLPGWENHDAEMDLRKRLPFPDGSMDFIFAEHVVEHVTIKEAWCFFSDCHRILKPGGVVRIAVPDIARIWRFHTPEYGVAVKAGGHGNGSARDSVKAAIFEHGHQAAWTQDLLEAVLYAVGFHVTRCSYGQSNHTELEGIEGHGKVVGQNVSRVETSIAEGTK